MDYKKHYWLLIDRARDRTLLGYRERHHVLPRCMGGSNCRENIVSLTAEEHFIAHQLLVKMHPCNTKLANAAFLMAHMHGNKEYGWIRRRHALAVSETMRGNTRTLGYKHTDQARAKIGAAAKGNTFAKGGPGNKTKMSPERRIKAAAHLRALPRRKVGEWTPSLETRKKWSEAMKRRNIDQRGEKNYCSKLSLADARYIRHLCSAERHKQKDVAELFGISVPTVSMIVNRHRWNY